MKYWVLGKFFADDHDRAIRYLGTIDCLKVMRNDIPKDGDKVSPEWCDKCGVFHLTRKDSII